MAPERVGILGAGNWPTMCPLVHQSLSLWYSIFLNDRLIERQGGSTAAIEGRGGEQPKFDLLTDNGNWRLVFTTGDVKTQKKIGGKISYVPIKAVQVKTICLVRANTVCDCAMGVYSFIEGFAGNCLTYAY